VKMERRVLFSKISKFNQRKNFAHNTPSSSRTAAPVFHSQHKRSGFKHLRSRLFHFSIRAPANMEMLSRHVPFRENRHIQLPYPSIAASPINMDSLTESFTWLNLPFNSFFPKQSNAPLIFWFSPNLNLCNLAGAV